VMCSESRAGAAGDGSAPPETGAVPERGTAHPVTTLTSNTQTDRTGRAR
jgi:hypothetical protein